MRFRCPVCDKVFHADVDFYTGASMYCSPECGIEGERTKEQKRKCTKPADKECPGEHGAPMCEEDSIPWTCRWYK